MSYSILFVFYDFLKFFYMLFLFFKIDKNNFYLFSTNYSIFYFVFKTIFKK